MRKYGTFYFVFTITKILHAYVRQSTYMTSETVAKTSKPVKCELIFPGRMKFFPIAMINMSYS